MAAKAGRDWAFYIYNGTSYIQVAGLRTKSFKANNTEVDVTNADSTGRWRELLGAAGVQTLDIDVAGIYQQDAGAKLAMTAVTTAAITTARLVSPGIQIDGSFLFNEYSSEGPYNEGTTFSLKIMSSGQPTIAYS
jgi:TP901-1 family phage major tail protein